MVFNRLYVYQRSKGSDKVIIVLNPGEKRDKVKIPLKEDTVSYKRWVDLFTENEYEVTGDCLEIKNLPGFSALVLKPNKTQFKNCVV